MTIEEKNKALAESLKQANASVEDLNLKVTDLSADSESAKGIIAKITKENDTLRAELAILNEKLAGMTASEETASKKAARIAAEVGVEPIEVKPESGAKDRQALRNEFLELHAKDPKQASAFFLKNRNIILGLS